MSLQNFFLKKFLRSKYKPRFTEELALDEARAELDSIINDYMPAPCKSLALETVELGGIRCERIHSRKRRSNGTLLYLHGGMFCMGSALSHRGATVELAKELGLTVVVAEYRLVPEHPFPAAVDDAEAAYKALLECADASEPLYICGDQAGACLSLLLALRVRDQAIRQPDLVIGLSGLFDLTLSSASHRDNADEDCCNSAALFRRGIDQLLDDPQHAADGRVSPLFADLAGLPPVMLQFSRAEMLRDDSRRLAEAIEAVGGEVVLDEWADVPSCWHLAAVGLPEGRTAIKRIGRHMRNICR